MKDINDVLEYLYKQKRKDLADAVIRELRKTKTIERITQTQTISPFTLTPNKPVQPWQPPTFYSVSQSKGEL